MPPIDFGRLYSWPRLCVRLRDVENDASNPPCSMLCALFYCFKLKKTTQQNDTPNHTSKQFPSSSPLLLCRYCLFFFLLLCLCVVWWRVPPTPRDPPKQSQRETTREGAKGQGGGGTHTQQGRHKELVTTQLEYEHTRDTTYEYDVWDDAERGYRSVRGRASVLSSTWRIDLIHVARAVDLLDPPTRCVSSSLLSCIFPFLCFVFPSFFPSLLRIRPPLSLSGFHSPPSVERATFESTPPTH